QWVLHNAETMPALVHDGGEHLVFLAEVRREGKTTVRTLDLPSGWRRRDDLSWRSSSWDLRRMTTGGLLLEELPAADRTTAGLADTAIALRVKHVGPFGPHAAANQAGLQQGDV